MTTHHTDPAWMHGHAHEPNPLPPSPDTAFTVQFPHGKTSKHKELTWDVADLHQLATTTVPDCYIVSTGHSTSGPFAFTGVRLQDFLAHILTPGEPWHTVDVISHDGFGTRLTHADLVQESVARPALLAHTIDGQPLTRAQGLLRLIVPSETDDALRQVKWIAQIVVYRDAP